MSAIIEYIKSDARIYEILVRTVMVLFVSEGLRVAFRAWKYQTRKYTRAEVKKMSELFGVLFNLVTATWLAWYFSTNKPVLLVLSEGVFYGFGTVFVHYLLMKYLDRIFDKEKS